MSTVEIVAPGTEVAALLVAIGFAKSKSEARRAIKQGAVSVGRIKVVDPFARYSITTDHRSFVIFSPR